MSLNGFTRGATSIWRTFGAAGLRHRAAYEVRRRVGAYRLTPSDVSPSVLQSRLPEGWFFAPDTAAVANATDRSEAIERAERVARGEYQAYRCSWHDRPARGEWNTHPLTQFVFDTQTPWYRVPHLRREAGDIKDIWEPARFAWSYDLGRGWMLTKDDRFADAFWRALESFIGDCPPFRGVHWSCGQETAIRASALLWMEGVLAHAPSSTPPRLRELRRFLMISGERIADALGYALSQRNNHGISEAAGLIMIGARFRRVSKDAEWWLTAGHRWLELLVQDQFAQDGWYIQHSFNYARLALDQLVVAERALRNAGRQLSPDSADRVRAAVTLLADCVDDRGELPNHGANDGAYVLPLSTRRYRDYRPSLTAAAATFDVPLPADVDLDRETMAWLSVPPPARTEKRERLRVITGSSGWADLRVGQTRVFTRGASYESRPGHIDPLHVDVWIDGRRLALDAGTYRYNAEGRWSNALADVAVHNTLTFDDHPPALRGPRFLWLTWPEARLVDARIAPDGSARCELVNDSWRRHGILHRRVCEVYESGVLVLDVVTCPLTLTDPIHVHWLVEGTIDDIAVVSSAATHIESVSGDPTGPFGWVSDCYGVKRPATSVRITALPQRGYFALATGFGDRRSPDLLATALRRRATPTPPVPAR
ncbi:MAG TPA: heparinase II/III family protein [Gemmatimonadaceae bacterium]|nr:heparinase II/III family protein [Gemmatimonadaceae bacterium]